MLPDAELVLAHLGRRPRGPWRVAARCGCGAPIVIAVAPRLDDGSPFPTAFWLTCPRLVEQAGAWESGGGCADWSRRVAADPLLAREVRRADEAYRAARSAEGGGDDPCASVGVAGQADPSVVKCLHARLAAALAGVPDPIGRTLAADPRIRAILGECVRCRDLTESGPRPAAR